MSDIRTDIFPNFVFAIFIQLPFALIIRLHLMIPCFLEILSTNLSLDSFPFSSLLLSEPIVL